MAQITSNNNVFNVSQLIGKTLMDLLRVKPTLARFANTNHKDLWNENKPYATGTVYTIQLPTYPLIQYGQTVTPYGKQVKYLNITINTGAPAAGTITSDLGIYGWINAVRSVDVISQQLYIQDQDEWNRQFVRPMYDAIYAEVNLFLYRQLRDATTFSCLPRTLNSYGVGNESGGRFLTLDAVTFPRVLDTMAQLDMAHPEEFVFAMNSSCFRQLQAQIAGIPQSTTNVPSRFINSINEELFKKGILEKLWGMYIYHTPYIPYHYSSVGVSNVDGTYSSAANYTSLMMGGYDLTTTALTQAQYPSIPGSGLSIAPETQGYLLLRTNSSTNPTYFTFAAGDTLTLPITGSSVLGRGLYLAGNVRKRGIPETPTFNVTLRQTVTYTSTAAGTYIPVPVNWLPTTNELAATAGATGELQNCVMFGPTGAADSSNNVPSMKPLFTAYTQTAAPNSPNGWIVNSNVFLTGLSGMPVRILGHHYKIVAIGRYGLHIVSPRMSDVVSAENHHEYDEKARINLFTSMQGTNTAFSNVLRASVLMGSGGCGDNLIQIPYYPGF